MKPIFNNIIKAGLNTKIALNTRIKHATKEEFLARVKLFLNKILGVYNLFATQVQNTHNQIAQAVETLDNLLNQLNQFENISCDDIKMTMHLFENIPLIKEQDIKCALYDAIPENGTINLKLTSKDNQESVTNIRYSNQKIPNRTTITANNHIVLDGYKVALYNAINRNENKDFQTITNITTNLIVQTLQLAYNTGAVINPSAKYELTSDEQSNNFTIKITINISKDSKQETLNVSIPGHYEKDTKGLKSYKLMTSELEQECTSPSSSLNIFANQVIKYISDESNHVFKNLLLRSDEINELKIPLKEELPFKAKQDQITELRNQMRTILMDEKHQNKAKVSLVEAVCNKLQDYNPEYWNQMMDPNNTKISAADKKLINCFPEVKTKNDYDDKIGLYFDQIYINPEIMSKEEYTALVDYFVLEPKSHVDQRWVNLTCAALKLDENKIILEKSHFYIAGKPSNFIPDDGNCAFHCIQYLLHQKENPS